VLDFFYATNFAKQSFMFEKTSKTFYFYKFDFSEIENKSLYKLDCRKWDLTRCIEQNKNLVGCNSSNNPNDIFTEDKKKCPPKLSARLERDLEMTTKKLSNIPKRNPKKKKLKWVK